jgi:hypothetical protein
MDGILLEKFRPEVWKSQYFLEEDVVFSPGLGPFVKLIHELHVVQEMSCRFSLFEVISKSKMYNEKTSIVSIGTSQDVFLGSVVARCLPNRH